MDKNDLVFRDIGCNKKRGRDFIVGDIHGCYENLMLLLEFIGFNFNKDRLISVGDLIDRGPQNAKVLDLLDEPWFFAVRGNHEQMLIDYSKRLDSYTWFINGGKWSLNFDDDTINEWALKLDQLPYIIKVGPKNKQLWVLHAEYFGYKDTDPLDVDLDACIWGRSNIYGEYLGDEPMSTKKPTIVVGHTPLEENIVEGRHLYLDTGAFAKVDGKLSIVNARTGELYQCRSSDLQCFKAETSDVWKQRFNELYGNS